MALSPQDKLFYEEKLGWRGFLYLLIATMVMGALLWPGILYLEDYSSGLAGKWTFVTVRDLAVSGILLGCIVTMIMFALARFYLWMGWLPRRH